MNATLVKPNAVSHLADGRTIEVWSHVKANAFGASQARTASILFDRDGRMVRLTGESDVTGH